jgi:hypothetical protein
MTENFLNWINTVNVNDKSIFRGVVNLFRNQAPSKEINYGEDNTTEKKEVYQIAICQSGKFAVTFDTGKKKNKFSLLENNLHIILNVIFF